ncbi:hypothetical protein CNMCM6106_004711 [Aspergillus hiratsukae]|uniref:Uncharacterized protein n=1 Tax=Aspergillus hiratsukae TaxID=1194566 RepID=A0A8H6QD37_9EURO|nr:hypothetical protein CNMCM6106_004711 [Aspergillus hiratsukae]
MRFYGESESDTSVDNTVSSESRLDIVPNRPPQPSQWPMKLLATFTDDIQWLFDYTRELDTKTAIQNRKDQKKDERIEDIQRVEGRRVPSNEDKVFRALAQRSMGIQFTQIQHNANVQTRVDYLLESIRSSGPEMRARIHKRTNFVSKYLDRFGHAHKDREIVLRGIHAGVKRLLVEKLFAQKLQESNRPIMPEGISAFTALKVTAFDRLLFEDIPYFLDQIFRSEVELIVHQKEGHQRNIVLQLPDALVALSSWMQTFQKDYDNDRLSNREIDSSSTTLEYDQRSSMRHCSPPVLPDLAMLSQLPDEETLPHDEVGHTPRSPPIHPRISELVVHQTTMNPAESKSPDDNVDGSSLSLQYLYQAPHAAAGAFTEGSRSKTGQKRLRDDDTIATEPARKRSTAFPSSGERRDTTPSFDSQAGNIDIDGRTEVPNPYSQPEPATEQNCVDDNTRQSARTVLSPNSSNPQEDLTNNALPEVFDHQQTLQPLLPPDSGLQGDNSGSRFPNVFDPRQAVQPILPPDFGLRGDLTNNTLAEVFDHQQTLQPMVPPDSGLQGDHPDSEFPDMFDPRQTVQPVLPPDFFGSEGHHPDSRFPDVFDPRQAVQRILPPDFSLQANPASNRVSDVFDPRQTLQPILPPDDLSLHRKVADSSSSFLGPRRDVQPILVPDPPRGGQTRGGSNAIPCRKHTTPPQTNGGLRERANVQEIRFPFADVAVQCS